MTEHQTRNVAQVDQDLKARTLVVTGCPCGCGKILCPRCYGHNTGEFAMTLTGWMHCTDCEMIGSPGELLHQTDDAKSVANRKRNREWLEENFNVTFEKERYVRLPGEER